MQVKSRREILLDYRESLFDELIRIANNRPRAEWLVRELRQNEKDLSSGEGAYMGKRTVKSAVIAHLLSVGHAVPLGDVVDALVPDTGKDAAEPRANVSRSILRTSQMGGEVVLRKDGMVDLRKWPK